MKVDCIKTPNITFKSGKINIYSDFDGTYFPVWQKDLHDIKPDCVQEINAEFKNFDNLLKKTKGDITFKITTGRTFGEFKGMTDLINSKGLQMPYPDSFISKNGSDEFIKIKDSKEIFPYDYSKTELEKEADIEKISGWNKSVKTKIKELLEKFHFEIIEHDSEYSVKDHGAGSLFSNVNYDSFELADGMSPQSEWKVGLRRDGNLKINISYPYDMIHVPERKAAYDDIHREFEKFLTESNIKFVKNEFVDNFGGNRPTVEYYPQMKNGKGLSKLFDTKLAVERAIRNNDFVITAGDGINDYEMLNPLNYLEGDTDLANPATVGKLKKLPFIGVVIKGENSGLEGLYSEFGKYGKIIEVEKGHLKDGIITAIKQYAKNNSEFMSGMSESLKNMLGIAAESIEKVSQNNKSSGKIIAIIGALAAGISGIVYALKAKKEQEVQNENK